MACIGSFALAQTVATLLAERTAPHRVVLPGMAEGQVYDGVSLLAGLAALLGSLILAGLHHYRHHGRFGATLFALLPLLLTAACGISACHVRGGGWSLATPALDLRLLPAALLILWALLLFGLLAAALATRLPGTLVSVLGLAVLVLGLAAETIVPHLFTPLNLLFTAVIPDLQHFWLCDALARGGHIPWSYVADAGLFAATRGTLFALCGIALLRSRDLG